MQILFVEGVSGVGKSTTTQKLAEILRDMGFSVNYYREFDFPNPIDFYCTAYLRADEYEGILVEYSEFAEEIKNNTVIADDIRLVRYYNQKTPLFSGALLDVLCKHEFCWNPTNLVPLFEYCRVYKTVWEQFAQNIDNPPDYLIFDGSLMHHPINDMMRNYNATCEQIASHLNTLIDAVSPFQPQIIYLSSDNVAERLKKACISRGENLPSDEGLRFWENRKKMDMAVMRHISVPCDIYDITRENWDECIASIKNKRFSTTDKHR